MSELTEQLKKIQQEANELKEKQHAVYKKRVESQYKQLQTMEEMDMSFDNLPIGENIAERYSKLAEENEEYFKMAKNASVFLDMEVFKDKVALFPRNIILISAETGTGKSTTVANFVSTFISKGKKKVLIITNEEYPHDILNRILFLQNNWVYSNHDDVTPEQLALCKKAYPILGQRIEIIHDGFNGGMGGVTTTLEGIKGVCGILKKKLANGDEPYDAILIDYIQNVSSSVNAPGMAKWQVMQQLGTYLDNFKGQYPAPIIAFSQLKSDSKGEKDFKERLEGFKGFMNHATTAIELKVNREYLYTEWIFRKNRFKSGMNTSVFTGFDRGKYVEYTNEFKQKTLVKAEQKKHADLMGNIFKTS